jgi:hypothetical protein
MNFGYAYLISRYIQDPLTSVFKYTIPHSLKMMTNVQYAKSIRRISKVYTIHTNSKKSLALDCFTKTSDHAARDLRYFYTQKLVQRYCDDFWF